MNNLTWSKLLLETLKESGVRFICLAPGSRSSPLALAAADSGMEVLVHFDERALGFLGLGLAKTHHEPVAILVTSGTAVGNLLPSVMEAFHDQVPLVILSADRPPELRDCGANQTSDQVKIFANFVRAQVDLPCADPSLTRYLASAVSLAVHTSRKDRGPIQINCMLREPLANGKIEEAYESVCLYEDGINSPHEQSIIRLCKELETIEEGLVLCGQDAPLEASLVAKKLSWPLFNDISSSLRGRCPHEIRYYETLVKNACPGQPKAIVQFGRRITSKFVLGLCKESSLKHYIQIDDSRGRFDPHHLVSNRITANPKKTALMLCQHLNQKHETAWLTTWKEASSTAEPIIQEILTNSYSEAGLAQLLAEHTQSNLFFANSMPIRDGEAYFFPKNGERRIFVNRGLSGIDGNLATCAGIAYASEEPLISIVGDVTFLHDLTSLGLLQECCLPILILVINNQGCGIFSFLPYLSSSPHFEKIQAFAHNYHFLKAAEMFGIPYHAPLSYEDLITCLVEFEKNPKLTIVELQTERQENLRHHREIESLVKEQLLPI
jgi:2-succinyl-5-enolpyruvyl-6-hydroxy-3-cyclohexene-1-carboxylate synthase